MEGEIYLVNDKYFFIFDVFFGKFVYVDFILEICFVLCLVVKEGFD